MARYQYTITIASSDPGTGHSCSSLYICSRIETRTANVYIAKPSYSYKGGQGHPACKGSVEWKCHMSNHTRICACIPLLCECVQDTSAVVSLNSCMSTLTWTNSGRETCKVEAKLPSSRSYLSSLTKKWAQAVPYPIQVVSESKFLDWDRLSSRVYELFNLDPSLLVTNGV